MIKVYIGQLCPGYSHHPILYPNLGRVEKKSRLFLEKAFDIIKKPLVLVVENMGEADFIMLPHEYFAVEKEKAYLDGYIKMARENDKKVLIFDWSDLDRPIDIPEAIVYRVSQYKSSMLSNVIVMPYFVEDLGRFEPKRKSSIPSVGFVGYAGYRNIPHQVKQYFKDLLESGPRKSGLYWRKRVIKLIGKDSRIKSNFVIRLFYTPHRDTIKMDPDLARREFLDNIQQSDFTLTPKGDANGSIRFFETLSFGRVPILIDTDCPLPLEGTIDYDAFILRVDWKDIGSLSRRIVELYDSISDEQFVGMQIGARHAFEQFLRADKFFEHSFSTLKNKYIQAK
ncbi:MAG TPA: exostosin family protein [Candidatus Paceibacterota bacterium]